MIFTLIGFMGCGKSSVGKSLADALGWDFADSDALIEKGEKMKIPEIFSSLSETGFRKLEYSYISDMVSKYRKEGMNHLIFALGGGAPVYRPTAELISRQTCTIYFKCPVEELIDNLKTDGIENRPLLKGGDLESKVKGLLSKREAVYSECASMTVHPYSLTPEMLKSRLR